jgi:hypothetical protein
MPFKHIPGLTIAAKNGTPETVVKPKIGRAQLEMLKTCGINSVNGLKVYIQRTRQRDGDVQMDVSSPSHNGKFRVVTSEDLGFEDDPEHRLYEGSIVVWDSVLDVSGLEIRNSKTVEFTNCVVVGDLNISMSDTVLRKVYLDRCLVLGHIAIHTLCSSECTITIESTNCCALEISGSAIESVDISRCKLPALYLDNLTADNLRIVSNQIRFTRLTKLSVKSTRINHEQFDLRNIAKRRPKRHDLSHLPQGFFEIISEVTLGDMEREKLFQTLTVLREHTALESDRRSLGIIRLIEGTQYQRCRWRAVTVKLLGAMQSPSRILCAAVCVFFAMALAYSFLPLRFEQGLAVRQLDFLTACYFSGVTMMTVGYGDIVPLGTARFLAVLESILGITVWSLYVVALVRKYID